MVKIFSVHNIIKVSVFFLVATTVGQAEPYQAEPYQAEPYQAEPYQAEPYQAEPYQAEPYQASYATEVPLIDGNANDSVWQQSDWAPIDKLVVGEQPTEQDFSGRFKVVWSEAKLYLLAEITDDIMIDTHPDPLVKYWDDDALEIFLDEDQSGGDHLKNYNAFAYHVALDNQSVDINASGDPRLLNDHIQSVWKRSSEAPNTVIWEVAIDVYSDAFRDVDNQAQPVGLEAGKSLGFMLAYCDSDGPAGREHFVGSHNIEPVNGDRNRGYIDASVFGSLLLVAEAGE